MKKLFVFCLAATMMLAFAGCNSKNDAEITTQPEIEIITASPETEAVTAMGDIIITRADTVFEEKTDVPEAESSAPETQPVSNTDALIGGWEYIYDDTGYTIIERIYINDDGSASFAYGIYEGEYIGWYDGTWHEENGTLYLDLVGGGSEWDENGPVWEEQNELNMRLGWKENANGITFIDYEDALVVGDAPGSSYNFVPSEF